MFRESRLTLLIAAVVVTSVHVFGSEPEAQTLIQAARAKFRYVPQPGERLLQRIAMGQIADFRLFGQHTDQLSFMIDRRLLRAATSSHEPLESRKVASVFLGQRRLEASLIQWLCVNPLAAGQVPPNRGIRVIGAWITGKLDLQNTKITFPLSFEQCVFEDEINLEDAEIKSLSLIGSRTGPINASGLSVARKLAMRDQFEARGRINLEDATIGGDLELSNARILNEGNTAIQAYHLKVKGSLLLNLEGDPTSPENGFRAEGQVNLPEANIGVNLDCKGGVFVNRPDLRTGVPGIALHGDGLVVGGSLFLSDGFKAYGEVRLTDASVNEEFSCCAAEIHNDYPNTTALVGSRLKVGGAALFYARSVGGFKAWGRVRLDGAKIGGDLNCTDSQFVCDNDRYAFDAPGITTGGSLLFRAARATRINLSNANIGNDLICTSARMSARHYKATDKPIDQHWSFLADGIRVQGKASFDEACEADAGIILTGASIGRNIDFTRSMLSTAGGPVLALDRTIIGGNAILKRARMADGPLILQQASIRGDLNCSGAQVAFLTKAAVGAQDMTAGTVWPAQTIIRQEEPALNGDGVKIEGDAFFDDGFDARGVVTLSNAKVTGQLVWKAAVPTQTTVLRLRSTKVGVIKDDVTSWPQMAESLDLEGFAYDRIDGDTDIDLRKSWLAHSSFSSQSYQQMADVFRKVGMTVEAKQILVASEEQRGDKLGHKWSSDRLWHYGSGRLMAYGYHPLRALTVAAWIIIVGSCVFWYGHRLGCIKSTARRSQTHPQFCALVYSLDVFLPVIKLFQKDYWVPVVRAPICSPMRTTRFTRGLRLAGRRIPDARWLLSHCVRLWHWAQIVVGWVITTLVVAGLAGLIRT
jgi:hypothetical protein